MIALPVRATGTLTIGAAVPTAADTVTVGDVTYTWRAAVGATINEVKIGADVTVSAANFVLAINAGPTGSATLWGSATVANPYCTATSAAGVVTVTAKTPGVTANVVPTTESGTNTVFAATALSGGTGSVNASVQDILDTMQPNSQLIQVLTAMRAS